MTINQEFQDKCTQLTDDQLKELLHQVCGAMLNRDMVKSLKAQKPIGDMARSIIDHAVSAWEISGGVLAIYLDGPTMEEPIKYETGVSDDTK